MKPSLTISIPKVLILFGFPTGFLYLTIYAIMPAIRTIPGLHPAMSWFIGGSFVFKSLLITAVGLSWMQLSSPTFSGLKELLCIRPLSRTDRQYILWGLLAIYGGMGLMFGLTKLLHVVAGTPLPEMTPAALSFPPFQGHERWMLLVWAVMFFFNIAGEECLWRGYIQQRQLTSQGNMAWLINGTCWAAFHIPFGWSMILMALPAFIVIPYIFQQTRNTTCGIVLHGLMNGPVFILISLGVLNPAAL